VLSLGGLESSAREWPTLSSGGPGSTVSAKRSVTESAAFFQEFDSLGTGYAQKLFDNYIAETEHRRLLDRRAQQFPFIVDMTSRICAFLLGGGFLTAAVLAMYWKSLWLSAFFGSGVIVAVVNAFLRRRGTERSATGQRKAP
jgi:uncharacterized membrane protein